MLLTQVSTVCHACHVFVSISNPDPTVLWVWRLAFKHVLHSHICHYFFLIGLLNVNLVKEVDRYYLGPEIHPSIKISNSINHLLGCLSICLISSSWLKVKTMFILLVSTQLALWCNHSTVKCLQMCELPHRSTGYSSQCSRDLTPF